MTKNLTKSLIDLRCFGFASQRVTKLRLDHTERRFDIASLVVLLQKPRLIETKVVTHLAPQGIRLRLQSMFELNIKPEFWNEAA